MGRCCLRRYGSRVSDSITLCGSCAARIEPGALRCKACDAPFEGPRQETRIDAAVEALATGMQLSLNRAPRKQTTLLEIMADGQKAIDADE